VRDQQHRPAPVQGLDALEQLVLGPGVQEGQVVAVGQLGQEVVGAGVQGRPRIASASSMRWWWPMPMFSEAGRL
jgi:hypothetical protein